jgi:hypothetical protein
MSDNLYIVSKTIGGRIVLDTVWHGERLQLVRGKDYADARSKVNVPCYHNPGYGWFHDESEAA